MYPNHGPIPANYAPYPRAPHLPLHSQQHQPPPAPLPPLTVPSPTMRDHQQHYNMGAANVPPPSPSVLSETEKDEENYRKPGPPPITTVWDNKIWALEVVQQPKRARMCGFGDKVGLVNTADTGRHRTRHGTNWHRIVDPSRPRLVYVSSLWIPPLERRLITRENSAIHQFDCR